MKSLIGDSKFVKIRQIKEKLEIFTGWETANKYQVLDEHGGPLGYAAERKKGILGALTKNFLKSHRPMDIDIWNSQKELVLTAKRPFFFFFSDMRVYRDQHLLGEIKTRFGIIKRKYDLLDARGSVFARIESPRWRLWTFQIKDSRGEDAGQISKKWGGVLKEVFSDSDSFGTDLSKRDWKEEEQALILLATLSIDLDFFEENSSSVLGLFD